MSAAVNLILCALLAVLAAPLPAAAQGWKDYTYPDAGFTVQFPSPPTISAGVYRGPGGASVPATIYSAHQDNVMFSVTVADFSQTTVDQQTALADAVKTAGQGGEIKADTSERIDQQYGHDITVAGKDGSRSSLAIFFVGRRLYELNGTALPPDADSSSGPLIRFQQTLSFVDAAGQAPRRPEDGGGPPGGGPGGRGGGRGGPGGPPGRGPPPPSAFEDCAGKAAGDAVQHATPQGVVAATCVAGPQGLFARPNMPPPPPAGAE